MNYKQLTTVEKLKFIKECESEFNSLAEKIVSALGKEAGKDPMRTLGEESSILIYKLGEETLRESL